MGNKIAKDVANIEYPKNLYCHITGLQPDDINIPEHSVLLRNINMAMNVFKEEYPDQFAQRRLKIIEMRYKNKMSMSKIGESMDITATTVKNVYIDRFIRIMRHPKFYYIIRHGERNPDSIYCNDKKYNDNPNSIKTLGLSTRAYNCLSKDGIMTIAELCSKSEAYILSIKNVGLTVLNEIKEKLTDLGLSLEPFDYTVLMEDISELGLEDELYNKLKKDNFSIIGDLIRYNKRLDSLGYPQYWRGEVDCINNALKTKGLSLNIKIPAQVIKKDILHELLYELSYEDACKYLLKLRTFSEPK